MEIFQSDTRVFFNKDCAKYGVDQLTRGIILNGKQLYKWHQIAKGNKVYTPYKAVAIRWAKLWASSAIEVRADMQSQSIREESITIVEYVRGSK